MNPTSTLQQQFPLSPRKFWKKMAGQIIGIVILDLVLGGVIGLVFSLGVFAVVPDTGVIILSVLVPFIFLFAFHAGLYSWYIKTYIARYYYAGEEHFITIKKGVFAPAEIHVQWQKIQDVYVDQDILDRIMGLYDVHIASATAASGIEAHIDGVDQAAAEGLKKFLLNKVSDAGRGGSSVQNTVATQSTGHTPGQMMGQSPQQSPTITLTEEISNNVYPLSNKWLGVTLASRIIGSFAFPAFILLIIWGQLKDVSVSDYWAYVILAWLALSVLTIIVRIVTLFLWKHNYAFSFNPDNIYYKEGVISISEKHMPYSSIQDVAVTQGVIERLFGLAKVRIENAATQSVQTRQGPMAVFTGVLIQGLSLADANKITDLLKTTVLGRNTGGYGL